MYNTCIKKHDYLTKCHLHGRTEEILL